MVNAPSASRESLALDHSLRKYLIGHDVVTVTFMGWAGLKNGELRRNTGANRSFISQSLLNCVNMLLLYGGDKSRP